jgi:hypothetical protein
MASLAGTLNCREARQNKKSLLLAQQRLGRNTKPIQDSRIFFYYSKKQEVSKLSIDINIHISADDQLVNAISDVAGCLAAMSMAKTGVAAVPLPEKTVSAPTVPAEKRKEPGEGNDTKEMLGKPMTAKQEKEVNDILSVTAPSDPKPDPNAIIDKKLHVSLRKAVATYCQKMGDNAESKQQGKENVRKWLQDRNLQGLSAMTYKDMDEFIAFLEAEAKEEVKENA